jgi:GNAT superfamily N-acetyltransferase
MWDHEPDFWDLFARVKEIAPDVLEQAERDVGWRRHREPGAEKLIDVAVEGSGRLPDKKGELLTFVAVCRDAGGGRGFASIHALVDLIAVGSLKWDAFDTGEVTMVQVNPDWRRRGIGAALFKAAEAATEIHGWRAAPLQSSMRSSEGDPWARALGAEPATELWWADDELGGREG